MLDLYSSDLQEFGRWSFIYNGVLAIYSKVRAETERVHKAIITVPMGRCDKVKVHRK